jgi:hypothetical protein
VGTLDANGQPAKFAGLTRLDVLPGNSSTPANEADVNVGIDLSDVRKRSDLSDYAGELGAVTTVRITDKFNSGPGGDSDPATVSDLPFPITVPCSATTDTTIGGACSVHTSFNSILPGTAIENNRANWQVGEFQVFDGGSDGLASTSPNTLFARQGIFIP